MTQQFYSPILDDNTLPEKQEKSTPKTFTKVQQILSYVCLLLGFLFIRLCCYRTTGLLTTLLFWAITALNLWFLRKNGKRFTREQWILTGITFLFGAVYTITANGFLKFLTTVFLIIMEAFLSYSVCHPERDIFRFLPISLNIAAAQVPFSGFKECPKSAVSVLRGKSTGRNLLYVAAGLLIAVPLTFIVGGLLASADDNMARLMSRILELPLDGLNPLLPHLFFGILCGFWLFGAISGNLSGDRHPEDDECESSIHALRFFPNPMAYTAITPVCILYILYFFSQMGYFLGGFTGTLAEGFTYAGYARQGFFELCAICLINAFLIGILRFCTRDSMPEKNLPLKIYTLFLCIASLVLAGTAIAKMLLYIGQYGMTPLRIYTTWFMLLLIIGFVLVLIRQLGPKLAVCRIGFYAFVLLFGLLCFSRPDAWMVKYNAEMYLAGNLEEFDDSILSDLSDDALSALLPYSDAKLDCHDLDSSISFAIAEYEEDPFKAMNLSAWMILLEGGNE